MRSALALLAAATMLLVPALSQAAFEGPSKASGERSVAVFYYAWYGTPARDGAWRHWDQRGAQPPRELGANYYPARGPYSSDDRSVLAAHMRDIAAAGIDTVILSWWGRGSEEDERLPAVAAAARDQGLVLAVHLEPYTGRTAETVAEDLAYLRAAGVVDVYVYDSGAVPDEDWARLNATVDHMRLFANTRMAGKAKAGGFAGLYTYDVLLYRGRLFPRMCAQAHRLGLLCAPSVGPGYDARNATGDERVRPRRDGETYDAMWRGAVRSGADVVTITSYNEWHEGTQIEAARPAGARYSSYEGAWGLAGAEAQTAYLERTAYWAGRYIGGARGVTP